MSTEHLLDVKIYCFLKYTENKERLEALFIFRISKTKMCDNCYRREFSHAENCFIIDVLNSHLQKTSIKQSQVAVPLGTNVAKRVT